MLDNYLFVVARWLLCLLSDYKNATCSERKQLVIRQQLYLIGEQEYLIRFTKYLIGFSVVQSIATTLHMQVHAFRSNSRTVQ